MSDPAKTIDQNILPVQALFNLDNSFNTFIGQGQPFYASINPNQSGLNITNSTINSTTIGATTPSTGVFTNMLTTTGQVTTTPSGNTDIANKFYVDTVAQGLGPKAACKCATTANITLSGLQTIDGYTTLAGDRVLVKNQSSNQFNGIYNASAGAWTRSTDMDVWSEVPGAYTVILNGVQANTAWVCTSSDTGTIDVTPITFVLFSGVSTYTAGTGLTLAANQFSITNTGVTAASYGSASQSLSATVNAQGQLTSLSAQSISIGANQVTSGTFASSLLSGSYTGITGVGTLTAGTWNGSTIGVGYGGTGANTFTAGYLKASGTAAFTTVSSIPSSDITGLGTMSTQNANNVNITGGTIALTTPLAVSSGGSGATTLTGYLIGNGTSAFTASTTIPTTALSGTITNAQLANSSITINGNSISLGGSATITANTTNALTIGTGLSGTSFNGSAAVTIANTGVLSFSAGTTGFTPSTTTTGAVTLGGLLSLGSGGTNANLTAVAGGILYSGASALAISSAGTTGQFLQSNGAGAPTWATPVSYATVTDDTTTVGTRYPLFANQTSGSLSTEYTSSTKLQYNPSTGLFTATGFSGSGASLTSIPNSALNNSSITVGSTAISLGGSATTIAGLTSVTSTTFVGALTGNASSATTAITATNATNVAITDDTTSVSTYYPILSAATTGNNPATTSSSKLSFVPNTGLLTTTAHSLSTSALTSSNTSNLAMGGNLSFSDTGILANFVTTLNGYAQYALQNKSNGAAASAEFIAYNNNGTASTNYATFGINSSGYTGTGAINAAGYSYFLSGSTDIVVGTIGANNIHLTTNSQATDAVTINTSNAVAFNNSYGTTGQVLTSQGSASAPTWQTPSSGSLTWQSVQTTGFSATANNAYPVNTTSGAVTATLPASPSAGQIIGFVDYSGKFATNNLTINPNGNKFNGQTFNAIVSTNRESILLVYIDSTQGWIPYSGFNTSTPAQPYSVSYLVVAGGGGGTRGSGEGSGGGGAGGLLTSTTSLTPGSVYTITVGAGAASSSNSAATGNSGSNSVLSGFGITTQTAIGGGGGGSGSTPAVKNGVAGGSGGGGGQGGSGTGIGTGGSGTSGQGNAGGSTTALGLPYRGGGGGGASAVGADGATSGTGNGGNGSSSSITGSAITYAGGGGGGNYQSGAAVSTGGTGGGGNGAVYTGTAPVAGTVNLGGGGGGGNNSYDGAAGGSGVVILSVPTANYTGTTTGSPTITTSGSNTIIKFTASGTYTA